MSNTEHKAYKESFVGGKRSFRSPRTSDILDHAKEWSHVKVPAQAKSNYIRDFAASLKRAGNRVTISPLSLAHLMAYCAGADAKECAGYFVVENFAITYVDLAGTGGSSGDVTLSKELYAECAARLNVESKGLVPTGQWHTHPNGSAFWSSKDEEDQAKTLRGALGETANVIWFLVFTDATSAVIRYAVWDTGEVSYGDINLAISGKEGIVNVPKKRRMYYEFADGAYSWQGGTVIKDKARIKRLHKRKLIQLGDSVFVLTPGKKGQQEWCSVIGITDEPDGRLYLIEDGKKKRYKATLPTLIRVVCLANDVEDVSSMAGGADSEENLALKVMKGDIVRFSPQEGLSDTHGEVILTGGISPKPNAEEYFIVETAIGGRAAIAASDIKEIIFGGLALHGLK